jgi:hypothetical protein
LDPMKSFCIFPILPILFFYQVGLGQIDSACKQAPVRSPMILSLGYRVPMMGNSVINSGHGVFFEIGINPAYYISKKQMIGLYGGIGTRDNFWNTSFDKNFVEAYNNSIGGEDYQDLHLAIIQSSKQLFSEKKGRSAVFPGCETTSFHTAALYGGIIARIPLPRFPMVLKLYTGKNETSYRTGNIITSQKSYNYFAIRRAMYGCELSLFPGIKRSNNSREFQNIARIFLGTISLYYEYCDLYNAKLYFDDGETRISIPFKSFLSDNFLKRYRHEYTLGVKLAVNVY